MRSLLIPTLAIALLGAGCSRALTFGFTFSELPDGGTDLSASTPDLLMSVSDLAAGSGHDLASTTDLAMTSPGDLFGVTSDLLTSNPDLKVRRPIGGPCANSMDCNPGLACLTTFNSLTFTEGFCTRDCTPAGPDMGTLPCGDAAACVPAFTNSNTHICAPLCALGSGCRSGYMCCPSVASSASEPQVCLPPASEYCK